MADLFKDRFHYESLYKLASEIQSVYRRFPADDFIQATMDETWEGLGFKQRVSQISSNLGRYLPADYEAAIRIIDQVIPNYDICFDGFALFFPAFVELFGQDKDNWDISMAALARYTPYASSEFAVRSFLIKDEERMMAQMYAWSEDENEHVRRLSSEGCRPRLPWGQALTSFIKDPSPILPILENLKTDSSLYVRRSVANNLNDISKTHPDLVMELAEKWYGKNDSTDWILRHGCRTLLKKGTEDVLALFGYNGADDVAVRDFALQPTAVSIGEDILFSFTVLAESDVKARIEYGIDYVKASGKRTRKLFKLSETTLKEKEKRFYRKKHSFQNLSTRKHYPGIHTITLIINGREYGKADFELYDDL